MNPIINFSTMIYRNAQGLTEVAEKSGDKIKVTTKETGDVVIKTIKDFIESLPEGMQKSFLERSPRVDKFTSQKEEARLRSQLIEKFGLERVLREANPIPLCKK